MNSEMIDTLIETLGFLDNHIDKTEALLPPDYAFNLRARIEQLVAEALATEKL